MSVLSFLSRAGSITRSVTCITFALTAPVMVWSCEHPTTICGGVGYNAVVVAIRDAQGNPQALGATVDLFDGTYQERDSSTYDPLSVQAAEERGGRTYDVHVTKPFYNDLWVRGVRAPGGGCVSSAVSVTVPVVLTLAAGAPPVRSIHLLPPHILLDRAPYTTTFTFNPIVDANFGVSQGVFWRLTGDTASVTFDSTTGTLHYRCLPKSGYLTLTAFSRLDSTVFDTADIAVQGHPAYSPDPPCA